MKQQWERLEAWLKANDTALLSDLNTPADDADIKTLEQGLGMKLPADFIDCLMVHDGQKGETDWLFSGAEFLSSKRILEEWTIWKGLLDDGGFDANEVPPDPGIQSAWWKPEWIPFTSNGGGDHLCLDLDPACGGRVGQIISFWHDDGARAKKADSFSQWFTDFVDKTIA